MIESDGKYPYYGKFEKLTAGLDWPAKTVILVDKENRDGQSLPLKFNGNPV